MGKKESKKKLHKSIESVSEGSSPIMDRRAMEKMMSDIGKLFSEHEFASIEEANAFLQDMLGGGGLPPSPKHTPLEHAQDLMYEAWDSSGKRRVKLARRALEISKDCADAYVLLAEETARSIKEAKDLYEQGVKAGERALGSQFEEYVGHFWGVIETRPYMRARAGLAECLWMLGARQQAIEHYTDMLRLNPNDNQGVRYILINCLLEEGSDEAVEKLLEQYEDDAAATWSYSRALLVFRQEGASEKANTCLKEALEGNRFIPSYLLGKKRLPKRLPEYIGFGDENEAIAYAAEAIKVWQKTEGALQWLTGNLPM
ncbi:MAG TPA: tetratricopeptide repeat protein [Thermodesulfobacteriota bacterium]|nr:tetratricopeptide repeat protein [Thermodesulfobacteriota bacterium]